MIASQELRGNPPWRVLGKVEGYTYPNPIHINSPKLKKEETKTPTVPKEEQLIKARYPQFQNNPRILCRTWLKTHSEREIRCGRDVTCTRPEKCKLSRKVTFFLTPTPTSSLLHSIQSIPVHVHMCWIFRCGFLTPSPFPLRYISKTGLSWTKLPFLSSPKFII